MRRACVAYVTVCSALSEACKGFTRWLVRDRRTNDDRLAHLSSLNVELDRRRIRRPLTMDEFGLLLAAAEAGKPIQNVAGPTRTILYIVGMYTGYRRNEIASVTPQSCRVANQLDMLS